MNIFQITASVIIMYIGIYLLNNVEISKKELLKYTGITFLCIVIIQIYNTLLANISMLFIIGALIYKNIKSIKKVVFVILYVTLITTIATYVIGYLLDKLSLEINSSWFILIGAYILLALITIGLIKLLNRFIILNDLEFKKSNNYLKFIFIIVSVFLVYIFMTFIFNSAEIEVRNTEIYSRSIIGIGIMVLLILIAILKVMARENELEIKREELLLLQNYISETQKLYTDVRKFKHDYINIITTLSSFIEKEDIKGLKEYFNIKIAPLPQSMNYDMLRISVLENIKINELRGFLMIKLIQAQEKKIKVFIEVPDEIDFVNWDIVEMCRGIGILIDNAIEEAEKEKDGIIRVAIIRKPSHISIIVSNSYYGETNIINKIDKPDFSTKGNGRGLGLSNLREFIDANLNITQETRINNGEFVQVLDVRN